jgi:hypothetical protein
MEFHACSRKHPMRLRAASGSLLCRPCIEQVEGTLRTLPGLYQESLHHIAPLSRRMNQTRVSGSRSKDHLNMSALDARRDIVAILESWSEFVVDELGEAAPPRRSVPQLTRMLLLNVQWLAAQPPAADFADEIEDLKAELLRTIDPGPGDAAASGRACVVPDCGGVISTSPRGAGGAAGTIGCSRGHSWQRHEWITLRPLVERERKAAGA